MDDGSAIYRARFHRHLKKDGLKWAVKNGSTIKVWWRDADGGKLPGCVCRVFFGADGGGEGVEKIDMYLSSNRKPLGLMFSPTVKLSSFGIRNLLMRSNWVEKTT